MYPLLKQYTTHAGVFICMRFLELYRHLGAIANSYSGPVLELELHRSVKQGTSHIFMQPAGPV